MQKSRAKHYTKLGVPHRRGGDRMVMRIWPTSSIKQGSQGLTKIILSNRVTETYIIFKPKEPISEKKNVVRSISGVIDGYVYYL